MSTNNRLREAQQQAIRGIRRSAKVLNKSLFISDIYDTEEEKDAAELEKVNDQLNKIYGDNDYPVNIQKKDESDEHYRLKKLLMESPEITTSPFKRKMEFFLKHNAKKKRKIEKRQENIEQDLQQEEKHRNEILEWKQKELVKNMQSEYFRVNAIANDYRCLAIFFQHAYFDKSLEVAELKKEKLPTPNLCETEFAKLCVDLYDSNCNFKNIIKK